MHIAIALTLLAVGTLAPLSAFAAGTVNRCTYAADPSPRRTTHAEALAGPGLVRFDCSGTIVVPEITIDNVTVLDATGQDVVLSAGTDFPRSRVFTVTELGSLTLINLTVENGNPFPQGAAGSIFNIGILTVFNSVIRGGFAEFFGGGILNFGMLNVTNSALSANTTSDGGAIYNFGDVSVRGSTISGNEAFFGSGIFNASGTVTLINSTISNNAGLGGFGNSGGGVFNSTGGLATLVNSTITANDALFGGGIFNHGEVRLQSSIIASQTGGGDCQTEAGATTVSQGYNIDSDGSCGLTDLTDLPAIDPLLGPLADNGGRTRTHALLPGSPAIDRIPVGTNGCGTTITTDQRGAPRPLQTGCESGSVEFAVDIRIDVVNERVNPGSSRRIRVVVFGAAAFDAGTVDPTTARFGPGGAPPVGRAVPDDVDRDGHLDLVLRFETDATGIECGDSTANLIAHTAGGVAIIGHDTFDTVRCR